MTLELLDGPFTSLDGRWDFVALANDECEVKLRMQFAFSGTMQEMILGPTFEALCNELLDAFISRAHTLYD